MNWTILINDLSMSASVGVLPKELEKKQPILINIKCTYKTNQEPKDLQDVFCYHALVISIENLIKENHFYWLENLAEKISQICFQHESVLWVQIKIEKTQILSQTKSVGVMIERSKP
jgi:FolB domain-containing protein